MRRPGPAVVLAILAPVIAEVLYGATRVSVLFVLIPEIMVWGCGALLIREAALRWRKGWPSLLLLGLALAIAEECVIQQTSLAPLPWATTGYGREWGVNWVYLLWALGYESVWVVLIPVRLVEAIYGWRRDQCWLRTRGLVVCGIAFVAGSFIAWYSWTQRAREFVFHMAPYSPPAVYVAAGLAAIVALAAAACAWPAERPGSGAPPRPWLAGVAFGAMGTVWSAYVLLAYGLAPAASTGLVMILGIALCAGALLLARGWSGKDWSVAHSYAAAFGGIAGCMAGGFVVFGVTGASGLDWGGKIVLNLAAMVWLSLARPRRIA